MSYPGETKEAKKERKARESARFIMKATDFAKYNKAVLISFKTLMKLQNRFAKQATGQIDLPPIQGYTGPSAEFYTSPMSIGKETVKWLSKGFEQVIKDYKEFFRMAKKRGGARLKPTDYKGVFSPIRLGATLRAFFNDQRSRAAFGFVNGTESQGYLMDRLTNLKQGYALRNSLNMILFIFIYANQLQNPQRAEEIIPNQLMADYLGGQPADYAYVEEPKEKRLADGTVIQGHKAIKTNNPNGLSTFAVLSTLQPKWITRGKVNGVYQRHQVSFNPQGFRIYFLQSIIALNTNSKAELAADPEASAYINRADVRQALIAEHEVINSTRQVWVNSTEGVRKERKKAQARSRPRSPKTQVGPVPM